jgi:hypothetical protein
MDGFINYSNNTDNYASKILINDYTEGENEGKKNINIFKTDNILEIILSEKDYNYSILNENEKKTYVTKKSLELSSFVDSNYENYNYNKRKYKKHLVSQNMQLKNNLSSVLFYNDYYNINIIICNKFLDNNKLYKTGIKKADYMFIEYNDRNFHLANMDDLNIVGDIETNFSRIDEQNGPVDDPFYTLSKVIKFDIEPDNFIYDPYLKPLSTFKLDELVSIANECDVSIKKENGKKKNKKEIYDEINLVKL